ncbi:hypothetical protein NMCA_05040 [Enterobacter ludwigii]|nr:hypothetical protein NMCA_05040 [Enterobacter ludwigii]
MIVYEQYCQKQDPGVTYLTCSYANELIEVLNEIDSWNDGRNGRAAGRSVAAGIT